MREDSLDLDANYKEATRRLRKLGQRSKGAGRQLGLESMAKIIRTEKRRRGVFGQILKLIFILFNVAMLIAVISGLNNVGNYTQTLNSQAEISAAGTGAAIGIGFIIVFWAAGDVILGLLVMFTRGKVSIIEETVQ